MKMDSNESAAKYQAEGYAFWKTMDSTVDHTNACVHADGDDDETVVHLGAGENETFDARYGADKINEISTSPMYQSTIRSYDVAPHHRNVSALLALDDTEETVGTYQWRTSLNPPGLIETNAEDHFRAVPTALTIQHVTRFLGKT